MFSSLLLGGRNLSRRRRDGQFLHRNKTILAWFAVSRDCLRQQNPDQAFCYRYGRNALAACSGDC